MRHDAQVMSPGGPGEIPGHETALVVSSLPNLPSIAEVRQRMAWMAEMRLLLVEYVQQHMDPARHMYTFEGGAYRRIDDPAMISAMLARGHKPALNQDGIHNLMSLFEADIDDQRIEEWREEGHYACRITLRLRYFGSRTAIGMGSATTRESKYAYRWVGDRQVPKGVDRGALKSREFEGRNGSYTRYRLDNDDVADVEATVLQMAIKRAKSSAVKSLPAVSEMFASLGDPDEDEHERDTERQEMLRQLRIWLQPMKMATRAKAIQAIFGEPLTRDDVAKLDEDRLAVALQVVEIATQAHIDWTSSALLSELRAARKASAEKAQAELYGEPTGSGAFETLRSYQADARLPEELLERIGAALSLLAPASEPEARALAGEVLDWLAKAEE